MKYLLDTHILIWWCFANRDLLGDYDDLIAEVEKRREKVGISIMSLWEVSLLVAKKRYRLDLPIAKWFEDVSTHPTFSVLPLSKEVILDSMSFGENFPKDPADQLIASTARCYGLKLMTADGRIRKSGEVTIA